MPVQSMRRTDSLYHTCLKERLLALMVLMLPALATSQTIKFTDVTNLMKAPGYVAKGVSCFGHGAAWVDISGDSLPDLYIASAVRQANKKVPETLYISHAGAAYSEEDGARGVSDSYGSTGSHGVILADYDNDGDLDIFNATTDDRARLYRNKGDGTFDNATFTANFLSTRVTYEGYGTIGYGTRALVAMDIDNDGDMDVYATNWGPVEDIHEVPWITPAQPNELFLNNGDGTFANATDRGCTPVNPSNEGTQGVTSVDIDEDGDMDIFVCHRNYALLGINPDGSANFGRGATPAPNDLFLNDGKGNFTEAAVRERGLWSESNDVNGTTFADYDNDGDLDAFVVYTDLSRPKVRVLQNNGKGYFTNVSTSVVIDQWGFTPFLFDMDNDGDLDLLAPRTRDKARIYLNDGKGGYALATGTGVEIEMYDPRGGSVADMDNDGDLDIYIADANKDTLAAYSNRLFRNDTPGSNRWLKVWGSGPKGDLGAFGTKIWLFEKGYMDDMTRLVGYRQVINGYGYLAQDDIVQHFGVALRDSVDIRIRMLDGTTLKTRLQTNSRFYFSKPASIAVLDGDNQSVISGGMSAQPLSVVVKDAKGKAVAGAAVTFSVDSGAGTFTPAPLVYTDRSGIARVLYTAGAQAGTRKITATTGTLSTSFTLTVTNSGPSILSLVSGGGQSAYTGQVLADSIRVKVSNIAGAGQSGHPVQFTLTAGNGKIKPGDVTSLQRTTNGSGIAAVAWQLGTVANSAQTLQVSSTYNGQPLTGSPLEVQATALQRIILAGRPKNLLYISGDGQTGVAGDTLAARLVVQLVDSVGVGCPDYDILFQVTSGDGTLSGAVQQIVRSDSEGKAAASLRLGPLAGVSNHHVSARYNGLAKILYFAASAKAAAAATLSKVDGDQQMGAPGYTLPRYLQVKVTDAFGNAVPAHPVTFAIASLDGYVNEQKSVTVASDSAGIAEVLFKLGANPGSYTVSVSSSYNGLALIGSPQLFSAIAVSDPAALQRITPDSTSGLAGQLLDTPLQVRVTDKVGYPVPNHAVTFWVRRGGGNLEGQSQLTRISDANGIAAVTPTLGSALGLANNVFEAQSFLPSGSHLAGSPVRFYISAKKSMAWQISAVSGSGESGQAGEVLAQPLAVRVTDKLQQLVAGQEVLFQVIQGSGKLGAGQVRTATVQSNASGIAQISFRLGSELGSQVHQVRASATDGVVELRNSPLTFTISAPYGQPDTSASTVALNSPVIADGVAECLVRIRLIDAQGHPVPGERIILLVSGDGNRITQPEAVTDAEGSASAIISSTIAGRKTVRVYLSSKSRYLAAAPVVEFTAGMTQRLAVISGDYQNGIILSALDQPLVVQAEDFNGNPVPAASLEFIPAAGSGEIAPAGAIVTSASGRAQVTWILGPSVGTQQVTVRAVGTPITRTLSATAALPQQITLEKAGGDHQFAAPGTLFADSLAVRVVDDRGSPIYGVAVRFAVLQGDAVVNAATAVMSDRYGLARVRLTAGSVSGAVRVQAIAPSGSPIEFAESVTMAVPARITRVYGDSLMDEAGSVIYPLMVLVTDQSGNPVANVPVFFESLTEGAEVVDAMPLYTGDDGQVAAKVRLATAAGPCLFQASSSHVAGSPLTFTLYSVAGAAADLVIASGDQQTARALKTLASPLRVRVLDRYGNGVAAATVQFTPLAGGGTVAPATRLTDAGGVAAVQWTLGAAGTQSLQAKCPALPGKQLLFSALLQENLGPVVHAADDTSVYENQTLILEVTAVDPDGGATTLAARNLPAGATFDGVNTGLLIWRPDYNQQGLYTIEFVASDENGGTATRQTVIRVLNRNRPPAIFTFQPESFYFQVPTFKPVSFSVQAGDLDGDPLSYTWRLNGRLAGNGDTLTILTGAALPPQFILAVTVRDQSDSVSHAWSVQQQATGVANPIGGEQLPESNRLAQNYPNPFNPETTISYDLTAPQRIEIGIYNMSGQCIRTLLSGRADAGSHSLRWDGRTGSGDLVASGVYYCVLRGEAFRQMIKLVFLK